MDKFDVVRAWGRILSGRRPSLSIEITRECPLRCPGCYAYEEGHLGEAGPLRSLADYKGEALVKNVMSLVNRHKPLHVSIVGGEPLVRFRELDILLPRLSAMGIKVQLVTSAVRPIPSGWAQIKNLTVVVSIDGLQSEHDLRRKPATYEKILANIVGQKIIVHCTVTNQMMSRESYFHEFLAFWSAKTEVRKIWFSLFTPQKGAEQEECLTSLARQQVLSDLAALRASFPKLDLPQAVLEGYRNPPQSPADCIFARTTANYTADLQTRITPCQFGGNPNCSQCGCIASAGLSAVGQYRLAGVVRLKSLFGMSQAVGNAVATIRGGE
ncbi:MAG: radical SAM protein [Acidobacteria bacterium]|nr:radical SAM protein [Acidobacteriota bacterium]